MVARPDLSVLRRSQTLTSEIRPSSCLHSRIDVLSTRCVRVGARYGSTGSHQAGSAPSQVVHRQAVCWRRRPRPLGRAAAALASFQTSSRPLTYCLLPRWEEVWCGSRTSSRRPAEHQNRRVYRLARCRKRQRVAVSSRTHRTWCRSFFRRRWSGWVSQAYQALPARA